MLQREITQEINVLAAAYAKKTGFFKKYYLLVIQFSRNFSCVRLWR